MSSLRLITLALSVLATLLICGTVFSQPEAKYPYHTVTDSCGTSGNATPSVHISATLADMWEHQASQMLTGVSDVSSYRERIDVLTTSIEGDIRDLCSGSRLEVGKPNRREQRRVTTLCVHEFEPSEIGIPASSLNPKPLVLLHQQEGEDSVRWLPVGSSVGSRTSALRATTRRLSPLNNDTSLVWLEIEETRTDFRSHDPRDNESTVKVETEWKGYILSLTATGSVFRLAKSVPLMHKITYGAEEDQYVTERQQIDVHYIGDSRIQISARTDTLTQNQTCEIGTHNVTAEWQSTGRVKHH